MNTNITVTATYTRSPTANLVADGGFPGTSLPASWTLNAGSSYGNSAATASVASGRATINITSVGANPWEPQLTQRGIDLVQGRDYTLTFTAQSVGGGRNMEVLVQRVGEGSDGWTTYAENTFALTTTSQNFSLPFRMTAASDPSAQLAFNLGGSTNNVIISNVSLTQSTTSSACPISNPSVSAIKRPALRVTAQSGSAVNVNFNAAGNGETVVRLYSLKGDVISTARMQTVAGKNYSHTFKAGKLPAGFYLVGLYNGGKVEQARVVVAK